MVRLEHFSRDTVRVQIVCTKLRLNSISLDIQCCVLPPQTKSASSSPTSTVSPSEVSPSMTPSKAPQITSPGQTTPRSAIVGAVVGGFGALGLATFIAIYIRRLTKRRSEWTSDSSLLDDKEELSGNLGDDYDRDAMPCGALQYPDGHRFSTMTH